MKKNFVLMIFFLILAGINEAAQSKPWSGYTEKKCLQPVAVINKFNQILREKGKIQYRVLETSCIYSKENGYWCTFIVEENLENVYYPSGPLKRTLGNGEEVFVCVTDMKVKGRTRFECPLDKEIACDKATNNLTEKMFNCIENYSEIISSSDLEFPIIRYREILKENTKFLKEQFLE